MAKSLFKQNYCQTCRTVRVYHLLSSLLLGPVVRTPFSANPGLNFNQGFFFFSSKELSRVIFYILFRVSNHQIVGKEN